MTDAPRRAQRTFGDVDEAIVQLREAGHRASAARRRVLEALFAADGPVSAELVADGLEGRFPRMDLASVYRNLDVLEAAGLVRHLHLGHGPGLYEPAGSPEREHLACERCGRVTSTEPARLDRIRTLIRRDFGYEARFDHFPILGLCAECARAGEAAELHSPHAQPGDRMSHADEHSHEHPHRHEHGHGHGSVSHSHPHTTHDHEHTEHEHEHSHGDRVHAHPHVHEQGLEHEHDHAHEDEGAD
jgi:Fur family ferric uptake transcriptional regulator